MEKIIINNEMFSGLWMIGWLFTIGYLGLPFFWKGVLAIILWPYYIGKKFSHEKKEHHEHPGHHQHHEHK